MVSIIILQTEALSLKIHATSYFFRFKTVGPFVVMIYRMITGDLLRFVIIYLVFVMGFSQAFYILFLTVKRVSENPMGTPAESLINMFMMSLSSFDDTFEAFQQTSHPIVAKVMPEVCKYLKVQFTRVNIHSF